MTTATPESARAPRKARLTICDDERGLPSIKLNDLEIKNLLLSGGLMIEFKPLLDGRGPDRPWVTMRFHPQALDFDFDVDLLKSLLAAIEADTEVPA
jgi:hypothetical protein